MLISSVDRFVGRLPSLAVHSILLLASPLAVEDYLRRYSYWFGLGSVAGFWLSPVGFLRWWINSYLRGVGRRSFTRVTLYPSPWLIVVLACSPCCLLIPDSIELWIWPVI